MIIDLPPWKSQDMYAEKLKDSGVLAVITLLRVSNSLSSPGLGSYVIDGVNLRWSTIPFLELTNEQFEKIQKYMELSETGETIATVVHDDYNAWIPWFDGDSAAMLCFTIICGLQHALILTFIIARLLIYWTYVGFSANISQISHIIQFIAVMIRFVFITVDPFGSRHIMSYLQAQMLTTLSFPFIVLSMLLVTLYWHELIHKVDNKVNPFLSRLKIPFFVICALLLAFEITSSYLRGSLSGMTVMTYITGAIYVIASLSTVIFYFYTQHQLNKNFKMLNSSKRKAYRKGKRRTNLDSVNKLVLAGGILMCWWIFLVIVGAATPLLWVPEAFFFLWFFGYLTMGAISAVQILPFSLPKEWSNNEHHSSSSQISRTPSATDNSHESAV